MDIFKANCDAIAGKDRVLAERLLSIDRGPVELESTRTGDLTFRRSGRYFHSRYDPWKEASIQAGEILHRKPDWVILFGQGCGYLLRTLIEGKKEKIIVYEPSIEVLASVLQKIDLSAAYLLENVFLCVDIPSVINAVRGHVDGFDNLVCYHLTPYGLSFPGELSDLTNRVQNAHITNKVAIKTNIASRLGWIENYFKNIGNFVKYPPIDALRGSFRDVPMVIAGAGPSLKKNGHLLRELKGKALIMAAITAYLPLVGMGVIPDFVIAAERIDLPEYFTYGVEDKKTRLVLAEVSHPAMFDRDVLGKFTFFNGYVTLSIAQAYLWGSSYFASTGGSVTTTALDIGVMFGCDPIIFVGQDLAFGDGATHVGTASRR
ncbi:MAG: motility associated factor glycosyltransferase family protein [Deltaproteobacteria bacterium]|nr:motility associated factor glycosyltransferase family protein [Deltaproteobacteria bacterium]